MKKRYVRVCMTFVLSILMGIGCLFLLSGRAEASGGSGGIVIHHDDACKNEAYFKEFYALGQGNGELLSGMEHTFSATLDEALRAEYEGYPFTWRVSEKKSGEGEKIISETDGGMYQGDTFTFTPRSGYTYSFYVSVNNGTSVTTGTYTAKAYNRYFTNLVEAPRPISWIKTGETEDYSSTELLMYSADTVAEGGRRVKVSEYSSALYYDGSSMNVSGFKATGIKGTVSSIHFWDTNDPDVKTDYRLYLGIAESELSSGTVKNGYYWLTPAQDVTVNIACLYNIDSFFDLRVYLKDGQSVPVNTISQEENDGIVTDKKAVDLKGGVTYFWDISGLEEGDNLQITWKDSTDSTDPSPTDGGSVKPGQAKARIKMTKIILSGLSANIAAGKSVQLNATVLPKNTTNKKLTWSSSNSKIATVTQTGIVTIKKGTGGKTVVITAKATDGSGVAKTFKIKVMKASVKKITVKGYKKTLKVGKTMKLKAVVTATKGKPVNKKVVWTSSNKKYATVSSKGVVKALKDGKGKTVKITVKATDGTGKKKTVTIKIK